MSWRASAGSGDRRRCRRRRGRALLLLAGRRQAWFGPVRIGIARTRPSWRAQAQAHEIEALYLRAIGAARHCIYIENQYLTVLPVAEARQPLWRAPNDRDHRAQAVRGVHRDCGDGSRARAVPGSRSADRFGRLRVLHPVSAATAAEPTLIHLHSKLLIVDDRLLVVGSANLCNRSMRLDTECNLAIEAQEAADQDAVRRSRDALLGEHRGRAAAMFAAPTRWAVAAAIGAEWRRAPPGGAHGRAGAAAARAGGRHGADRSGEPITRLLSVSWRRPRRRRLGVMASRAALTLLVVVALAVAARSGIGRDRRTAEMLRFADRTACRCLASAPC